MTLFKFRPREFHSRFSFIWGVTQSFSHPAALQSVLFSRSDYSTWFQSTQIRYPWKNVSLIYRLILLSFMLNEFDLIKEALLASLTSCWCGLQCHSWFSGLSVRGSWVRNNVLASLCVSGWCCRRRCLSPGAVGLLWAWCAEPRPVTVELCADGSQSSTASPWCFGGGSRAPSPWRNSSWECTASADRPLRYRLLLKDLRGGETAPSRWVWCTSWASRFKLILAQWETQQFWCHWLFQKGKTAQ